MYEEGSPEFKVQKVGQGYAKQLLEAGKDADSFYKGRILGLNNGKEILKVGADVVGGTLTKPLYEILIRELPQKYRPDFREQKLTGGQVKLDVNDDGTLTADDFKALRERTQKQMGGIMEGEALPTQEEQMQSMMSDKTESEKMQEELEPLPEEPKEEIEMESDEEMEESYLDFIYSKSLLIILLLNINSNFCNL